MGFRKIIFDDQSPTLAPEEVAYTSGQPIPQVGSTVLVGRIMGKVERVTYNYEGQLIMVTLARY